MGTSDPMTRTLADDDPEDVHDWLRAVATGFLQSAVSEEELRARAGAIDPERTQGAYVDGRCVATFRTFAQRLTLPGGRDVPCCAVTQVTVTATHRRRGLMSAMMRRALAAAKERGEVCASLIAAEYPIYGRHGFGPATRATDFQVDLTRAGTDRAARAADTGPGTGRIDLVTPEELRAVGPAVHERFRALPTSAGAIDRSARWWLAHTGGLRWPGDERRDLFHAVYRDRDGTVQGVASYRHDQRWRNSVPAGTLGVDELTAVTAEAELALWRYLLSVDWTVTVSADRRAPDDVLPLLLPDPRAARIARHHDLLWLRPLDVPALLSARDYRTAGNLVLEVRDDAGLAGGRYALDATAQGARCEPTTLTADLTLSVADLGSLCLGGEAASRLLRLGRLDEHRPGAADHADLLLGTRRLPWCQDMF
ncbi:GNAT family N-acetyltransferase [Streptomyces sp. OF8]|uniref:GNAT family N-acetyltransferase n=2 Tax=Streptomyces alkaliterrae TaxID=2213162 RepID=A0A5P0YVV9_9ACTN|nr:GNAT family N-acetyltransferase [Streptomyces alkaliterrae]MQS03612.1 GNAT family N-acetyltransferase [Streptomyces alkaliterrae]